MPIPEIGPQLLSDIDDIPIDKKPSLRNYILSGVEAEREQCYSAGKADGRSSLELPDKNSVFKTKDGETVAYDLEVSGYRDCWVIRDDDYHTWDTPDHTIDQIELTLAWCRGELEEVK